MAPLIGRLEERGVFDAILSGDLRYRILAVAGLAGVGKSTLLDDFRSTCANRDVPTGLLNARRMTGPGADHEYHPVVEALQVLDRSLRDSGCSTTELDQRLARYRKLHRQLVEKFSGSEQLVSAALRTAKIAAQIGSAILPIGPIATGAIDIALELPEELANQVAAAIKNLRKASDRELLQNPAEKLSEALLHDLNRYLDPRHARRVVLLFDEYELIPDAVDAWLRELSVGDYGQLDRQVLLVIGGRRTLGQDWTARGRALGPEEIKQLELQPFTIAEAASYLQIHMRIDRERASQMAGDLGKAGRLPLYMRLLAGRPLLATAGGAAFRNWSVTNDLVDRLFELGGASAQQQEAALAISVARSFDLPVVEELLDICGIPSPRDHFSWLEQQHFINQNAPAYTLHEPIREVFLVRLRNTDSRRLKRLHERLRDYYRREAAARGRRESARLLEIEAIYHDLSCIETDPLTAALGSLLQSLPAAYHLTTQWSAVFEQVTAERRELSVEERNHLERLAQLLIESWNLSNGTGADQQRTFDPAMDVFFTSLYRIEPPSVAEDDAELWLRYFESRSHMTSGKHAVEEAKEGLLDIWRTAQRVTGESSASTLLRFCVATDLGEACTRVGDVAEAVGWNQRALEAAEQDSAPLRQALALYQLSTSEKRQGKYKLALANVDRAIALFRQHAPSSIYHIGRFLLDKANTHTYLNQWHAAERAYVKAGDYVRDVSPQSLAELTHRLGWLKRVSGRLDEALADHEEAIQRFEEIEAELLQRDAIETSVLPFLRGKALHSMGNVLSELGRHDDALRSYDEASVIFQRLGNPRHEAISRKDRARSHFARYGLTAAESELMTALSRLGDHYEQEDKYAPHLAEGWLVLSHLRMIGGQLEEAWEALARAGDVLAEAKDVHDEHLDARVRLQRALLHVLTRDEPGVEHLLSDVEAYAHDADSTMWALLAHASLIRALRAERANEPSAARASLITARAHALRWNRYLPTEIDELWVRLAAI